MSQGSMIMIDSADGKFPAYVNKPNDVSNKTSGVIIIHEWWGLVPHVKGVADKYAAQGYVAIAPDLYSGASASAPDEARKLSTSVTTQNSKKMIDSTAVYLKALDLSRLGITGYCFGGTHAFNYVCESKDVSAGVIYYASRLPGDEQLAKISVPLLLVYGDQDQSVKPDQARQLELTLKTLGKNVQLLLYEGAPHAFANETNKQGYRPEATKDSWDKTILFFNTHLLLG
ncbi:MAG TPA: dienelactone hydrolase family protein [Nitrososphaerales archaeon]|nr:dienelactone hydrolase family protein [Nitrososphaerales archaeon]